MEVSASLTDKAYFGYIAAFGRAANQILVKHQDEARQRFALPEAVKIIATEVIADRMAHYGWWSAASRMLARALDQQLIKTMDLVSDEDWKKIVPTLNNDADAVFLRMDAHGLRCLKKAFEIGLR